LIPIGETEKLYYSVKSAMQNQNRIKLQETKNKKNPKNAKKT